MPLLVRSGASSAERRDARGVGGEPALLCLVLFLSGSVVASTDTGSVESRFCSVWSCSLAGQSLLPPTLCGSNDWPANTQLQAGPVSGLALQVINALRKIARLTLLVASRRSRPSVPYEKQLFRSAEKTALAGRNSAGGSSRFGFEHLGRASLIDHPRSGLRTHPRDDHPVGVLRCCRAGFQGLTPPGY